MRRILCLMVATLLVVAGCTDADGPDKGKGDKGDKGLDARPPARVEGIPTRAGTHPIKINVGGPVPRDYRLRVPPRLAKGDWRDGKPVKPLPLVLAMHGGAATATVMERISGYNEVADEHGFLVAYPEGFLGSWNAAFCCGPAKLTNTDDVRFLTGIVEKLTDAGLADPDRVYATGFSNGAGMAYRLACQAPDDFAAVAAVAAAMKPAGCEREPISVMVMHGTADRSVPYNGGGRLDFNDPRPFPPVSYAVNYWREVDGLPPLRENLRSRGEGADCRSTGKGGNGTEVALCRYVGGGHQWPDAAAATQWAFFERHHR